MERQACLVRLRLPGPDFHRRPRRWCGRKRSGRRPTSGRSTSSAVIDIAVAHHRRLTAPDGVRIHRMRHFVDRVVDLAPPRIRLEHALLDLSSGAATDLDAIAHLADAVGARRTTADRLRAAATDRTRLTRSHLIKGVLDDIATGTCSALEQAYLVGVAHAHGLPVGQRQASHRHHGDNRYRDVLITGLDLCVELDGRLHHDSVQARDADLDRDLDAIATDDLLTLRLSWGQCVDRACATAARLAHIMKRRGWHGALRPCATCRLAA